MSGTIPSLTGTMASGRHYKFELIHTGNRKPSAPAFLCLSALLSLASGFPSNSRYLLVIRWLLHLQPSPPHFSQAEEGRIKKEGSHDQELKRFRILFQCLDLCHVATLDSKEESRSDYLYLVALLF